jgi:hypothetical protein
MTSDCKIASISMAALLCLSMGSGCGNYSNDDVDFQLALPEQDDLEAKLQVSLSRADSAEYYKETRNAVLAFNALVVQLTSFVDAVRGYVPTSRNGNERTWGPFPDDGHVGWEVQIVMRRSTEALPLLRMYYWVQLRQVGTGKSGWVSLLTGEYTSQGSARTGYGDIHFDVQTPRAAGYPVDSDAGLVDLDHLDVCYDKSGNPSACPNETEGAAFVTMQIVNVPTANTKAAQYVYELAQENSGSMQFNWQGDSEAGVPIAATMHSRWLATGEGRADLKVDLTPNLPKETTLGTDCWGPDTVATYSFRLREGQQSEGDPSSCVF